LLREFEMIDGSGRDRRAAMYVRIDGTDQQIIDPFFDCRIRNFTLGHFFPVTAALSPRFFAAYSGREALFATAKPCF